MAEVVLAHQTTERSSSFGVFHLLEIALADLELGPVDAVIGRISGGQLLERLDRLEIFLQVVVGPAHLVEPLVYVVALRILLYQFPGRGDDPPVVLSLEEGFDEAVLREDFYLQ